MGIFSHLGKANKISQELCQAAESGNITQVKEILENNPNLVNKKDGTDATPLLCAAGSGRDEVVEILLAKGADVRVKGYKDVTALHAASFGGTKHMIEYLVEKGVDANEATMLAGGTKYMVELLIRNGADVNQRDKDGRTPLHNAAVGGNIDIVEFLLTKVADIKSRDVDGTTALHFAAREGHKEVVSLLLDKGLQINAKDSQGATPLFWAAWKGHIDTVALLLARGALVDILDNKKRTPLTLASEAGHSEIVKLLLDNGADVNHFDILGATPLLWATAKDKQETVKTLLVYGANSEFRDREGKTPKELAKSLGHYGLVELLNHQGSFQGKREVSGDSKKVELLDNNKKEKKIIKTEMLYTPKKGDTVIGTIIEFEDNKWLVDINSLSKAILISSDDFFGLKEGKELPKILNVGDHIVAQISSYCPPLEPELTVGKPGLGRITRGQILQITPAIIPRIIGRNGSMISMIKQETECQIILGLNGVCLVTGKNLEEENLAITVIRKIEEEAYSNGLQDHIAYLLKEKKKSK